MVRALVLVPLLVTLLPALAAASPPEPAVSPGPRVEATPAATAPAEPAAEPVATDSPPAEGPAAEPSAPAITETTTVGDGVASTSRDPAVSATPVGEAKPPPPPLVARHRLVYSNLLVARVNPLGLEDRFTLGYSYRLYNKTSALFRDAYFGLAFSPTFSPSITRIGAQLDFAPLTILRFRAGYYLSTWYGSQKFKAHPFHSPYDNYGPNAIGERAAMKQGISTFGGQAELGLLFQIKGGPVAIRNEVVAYHNNIRMPTDGNMAGKQFDVFYDLRHDTLVPAKGWFLTNDSDLLFVTKFGLAAGVRNSLVHVFYPDNVWEAGDDNSENPNTPMDRLGPIISHTFYDKPERRFNKPTLLFAAQWWLVHRFRGEGAAGDVHQGIPLFLLGFAFSGELVRSKDK
jgi:hypothetical protein